MPMSKHTKLAVGLAAVAFLVGSLIIGLGPEAHGITFRKGGESFSRLAKK